MPKFNISLNDFKNLDPNQIWLWPTLPRVLVLGFLGILVAGAMFFFVVDPELQLLEESKIQTESLKTEYKQKYELAANLEKYKKLRSDTEKLFGDLLRQLPNKSEMEALLNDINNAGVGRGLVFELFKPDAKEKMFDFYAELPITMEVTGTFHDIGEFNAAIAQLSRIVTINDLELTLPKTKESEKSKTNLNNRGLRMKMKAIAKTFRYLDEDEIKAQKKAKDAAKKSSKGGKGKTDEKSGGEK
jgi:type IV pilus assembly protein PilO